MTLLARTRARLAGWWVVVLFRSAAREQRRAEAERGER